MTGQNSTLRRQLRWSPGECWVRKADNNNVPLVVRVVRSSVPVIRSLYEKPACTGWSLQSAFAAPANEERGAKEGEVVWAIAELYILIAPCPLNSASVHSPVHSPAHPLIRPAQLAPSPPSRAPRDRKSTRLNSSHSGESRMPSSA